MVHTNEHLSALALIHMKFETEIHVDEVFQNIFSKASSQNGESKFAFRLILF